MRKLFTIGVAIGALVLSMGAMSGPAAADPVGGADLLSVDDAASVYPGLADGDRTRGRYGIVAPRSVMKDGRLKCDRYQTFRGTSRRDAHFFNVDRPRSVVLDQEVARFRTKKQAKAVMHHYRSYVRTCAGTHRTTDGEGGRARLRVRGWQTPRIGSGSVGMLDAFIQYGDTTWRRTVVARTRRTVTVQVVEPNSGKGSAEHAIEISRKAIANLS